MNELLRRLECRVPPLAQVVIIAIAMWLIEQAVPMTNFVLPIGASILCFILGALVSTLGVWEFRKAQTTVDPLNPHKSERLVTNGVYRFSRNPMYVGFLLMLTGWGLYLGHVISLVMLPVFVGYMTRFQILPEERHMQEKFGTDFTDYCDNVRRWV